MHANAVTDAWNAQAVIIFLALSVPPLVAPAILSRRRYLSVGRWLALAGFAAFAAAASGAAIVFGLSARTGDSPGVDPVIRIAAVAVVASVFGIGGCLLAAAVHPKRG